MSVEDFRGEENLYRNAVENCKVVLKNFAKDKNREIKGYYTEDVAEPRTPCFVIIVTGSDDEMRSAQNMSQIRYTIGIRMEIWYYHGDLTEQTKRNEITYVLWEVNEYLKKYITLNNFVPKLGVEVLGARWVPQPRGNRVLAGGVVSMNVRKLFTTTTTF